MMMKKFFFLFFLSLLVIPSNLFAGKHSSASSSPRSPKKAINMLRNADGSFNMELLQRWINDEQAAEHPSTEGFIYTLTTLVRLHHEIATLNDELTHIPSNSTGNHLVNQGLMQDKENEIAQKIREKEKYLKKISKAFQKIGFVFDETVFFEALQTHASTLNLPASPRRGRTSSFTATPASPRPSETPRTKETRTLAERLKSRLGAIPQALRHAINPSAKNLFEEESIEPRAPDSSAENPPKAQTKQDPEPIEVFLPQESLTRSIRERDHPAPLETSALGPVPHLPLSTLPNYAGPAVQSMPTIQSPRPQQPQTSVSMRQLSASKGPVFIDEPGTPGRYADGTTPTTDDDADPSLFPASTRSDGRSSIPPSSASPDLSQAPLAPSTSASSLLPEDFQE